MNVMVRTARRAGRSLRRDFGEIENLQVSVKGPGNFATAADRRAEEMIYSDLEKARPGYGFLGEEGGARAGSDPSHRWIVDPLDGTTNFMHGLPFFAISIALERDGVLIAGLVYNPIVEDMFTAERGKGAFFNDTRLRVAARRNSREAVVACGLPHHGRGDLARLNREFAAIVPQVGGLRHSGSSALDLAYVAAGRLDAYWDHDLKPWDVAAGTLLVREAGGFVTDLDGGDAMLEKNHIIAGNEYIQHDLLKLLKSAR